MTGDPEIGRVISLQATNTGERLVKLTQAYLQTDDGRQVFAKFWEPPPPGGMILNFPQSPLPASLVDGESLTVYWRLEDLEKVKKKDGFGRYLSAFFADPLGNIYADAYPGVRVKRNGWLWRGRGYAPPAEAADVPG